MRKLATRKDNTKRSFAVPTRGTFKCCTCTPTEPKIRCRRRRPPGGVAAVLSYHPPKLGEIIFITGTDTNAGKTLLAALLLVHLRKNGYRALAMKPFCTGDRHDVRLLQELQPGEIPDEVMNPYY